jgi:hypothetical protein
MVPSRGESREARLKQVGPYMQTEGQPSMETSRHGWERPKKGTRAQIDKNKKLAEQRAKLSANDAQQEIDEALMNGTSAPEEPNWTQSCVKMKLSQFCNDQRICRIINSEVQATNMMIAEGYAFANFHVTRLLEQGKDIPSLDTKFFDRCLSSVIVCKNNKGFFSEDFIESAKLFDALRTAETGRTDGTKLGNIKSDLLKGMKATASLHLRSNACTRLSKYLQWSASHINKTMRKKVVDLVLNYPKGDIEEAIPLVDKKGAELTPPRSSAAIRAMCTVIALRKVCPLPKAVDFLAEDDLTLLLPLYHHIMKDTEAAHAAIRGGRITDSKLIRVLSKARFTMLPTKGGFTTSYIPICSRALISLLRRVKNNDETPLHPATTDKLSPEENHKAWMKHFNVKGVETRSKRFGMKICTDGVGCTILMERNCAVIGSPPEEEISPAIITQMAKKRTVDHRGVDPGVSDVVVVASKRTGATSSYSVGKYAHKALIPKSNHVTSKWNEETAERIARIRNDVDKSNMEGLSEFTNSYLSETRALHSHRATRGYRNWRFTRYVAKQKAVSDVCDFVAPRTCTIDGKIVQMYNVVGYGDWTGASGTPIKRKYCGPQVDIRKELRRRQDSVLFRSIWEYRTSITCHATWQRLSNMKAVSEGREKGGAIIDGAKRGSVHKVLHCKSSKCAFGRQGATWNRDVNASRNMLTLLMLEVHGFERPMEFKPAVSARRQVRRVRNASSDPGSSVISGTPS